jgi:hypothetical protein
MKLEFLPDGSDDCPLLRFYGFRPEEASHLRDAFLALAAGKRQCVAAHELPGVETLAGCQLTLCSGKKDQGLLQLPKVGEFECILSPERWEDLAGLMEPFVLGGGGFQWLSTCGDAKWLFSKDGCW